jgi:hypothetical protein
MKTLLISISLFLSLGAIAQYQGNGGKPKSYKLVSDYKNIDVRFFAEPDVAALRTEDEQTDDTGTAPWRFGFNNNTALSLSNSGTWIELPNGDKIWQLVVKCEQALSVNLTFSNTKIPAGNELYVYNPTKDFILGKFEQNHIYNGVLGTELIPGNTAVLEYYVKKGNELGSLNISTVTHGYRTANEFQVKAFGSSGSCNMNVNCPDGSTWIPQRNSAVMLVSGSNGFCSGALINNTANDGKPYVLTANHCYSDPTGWIFRFNWQASDCANPASSPSFQSLSGAVLRSRRTPSDFCLVEITGGLEGNTVPLAYQPYFSGWNHSDTPPTSTVSIHHPSGDIKKISFDDGPASAVQAMSSTEVASSWSVQWDRNTTTEGGSSGSPLFDQNRRIIGQLWGGGASCSNLNSADYYGRLFKSWEPAGSNSTNQLKFWLDPSSSGAEFIDGYDPSNANPVLVDAGISAPQGVSGTFCGDQISPSVTISNSGTNTLTAVDIIYAFDGGSPQTYNWTGSLPQWQSTVVNLPTATLASGNHTFNASVNNPNANTDENANNNTTSSSFSVVIGGQAVQLNLSLDCYGSETSWELQDATGTALYAASGYSDDQPGLVAIDPWCLPYGCYSLVVLDSYGDGLEGGTFCQEDGSVDIVYNSISLGSIPSTSPNFGSQKNIDFCFDENGVGLENLSENTILVYPNPAKNLLTIQLGTSLKGSLNFTDISGKLLFSKEITSAQIQFTVDQLSAGTYFIQFNLEGQVLVKKLIIE